MIEFPLRWNRVGQKITVDDIDRAILDSLSWISCNNLALSGGLDSSLILWYLAILCEREEINCYVIAKNIKHPDYIHANLIANRFRAATLHAYIPDDIPSVQNGFSGDEIVKAFYDNLTKLGVSEIISCDGIDEYMCGYYDHQKNPNEETYFNHIRSLKDKHLVPLDKNSGDIKVYLPYLDPELLSLLSQIPVSEKVDSVCRKKMMVQLAEGKIPKEIIERRKYGFCDAMRTKENTFPDKY